MPLRPIRRARHIKKVDTLESGLVDFEGLETYMHPNPLSVPLYPTRGWKYHHLNHTKSSFRQTDLPPEARDYQLVALRNSPYQQVHMRVSSERVYHQVHQLEVPHPISETVEKALRDFERLDMLGAACLSLNLLRGSSFYNVDREAFDRRWDQEIPLTEKIDFISGVREDNANAVARAEILPPRLITSALKRVALHLRDPYLDRLANSRLASDPVFYPVKTPSHQTLLIKVNRLLALEFGEREEPLQTGADELELAA